MNDTAVVPPTITPQKEISLPVGGPKTNNKQRNNARKGIKAIRKACIKVNPDIEGKYLAHTCHKFPCPGCEKEERSCPRDIGLADVLLAAKGCELLVEGQFVYTWMFCKPNMEDHKKVKIWNLTNPLTLQSEETIRFIFNLLKNEK